MAARVGLEKTYYEVSEEVDDVVEVCAVVSSPNTACPIAFSFEVVISSNDYTAGIVT